VGRIAAGWHLAKLSLRVVWSDGSLSALVVLGGIASGAVALAFLVPAAVAYGIEEKVLAAVLTAIGVYLATLVATYFAVALAAAAADVLDGRDGTVRGGMAAASRVTGSIAGWALVLTTVNLALQLLRERAGILGSLLLGAATVAWTLATFLVVPILALEGLGPLQARSRASSWESSPPSLPASWEARRARSSRSPCTATRRAPGRPARSRPPTSSSRSPVKASRAARCPDRSCGAARASP
jgi:hypothetical protein